MTEQNVTDSTIIGWIVLSARGYHTGNMRTPIDVWTPFQKFAKVYKHRRWAQKLAARLGGQVIPVEQAQE
jgi:hypothetical protein